MANDLHGQRFGKLTAVAPTAQRKAGYTMWQCKCDCGNELLVESRRLKRGTIHDCGCSSVKARRDLRNLRFGRLTVLSATDKRGSNGNVIWQCKCDCGNLVETPSNQLLSGYKRSCGCLSHPPLKDYVGKRFGKLTILGYAGKQDGMHYWQCKCDCGNETTVGQTPLQSGKTQSCGCRASDNLTLHRVDGTCLEAIRSDKLSKVNTSGVRGVYMNKKTGKWVAQITLKGKTYYLGTFTTLEKAAEARKKAADRMFGEVLETYADVLNSTNPTPPDNQAE